MKVLDYPSHGKILKKIFSNKWIKDKKTGGDAQNSSGTKGTKRKCFQIEKG
jgi:hypothetical protein